MNRNHHPQLYSASPVASKRNVLDSPTNPLSSKRLSENSNPPEAVQTDEKEGTTESVFKTPDSEGLSIPTANNENEFYRFVDGPVGKTLTAIFENELLSIEEKIACSDPIIHRTPIESQYLYRKWRFKNTEPSKRIPEFVRNINKPRIRTILEELFLKEGNSLDNVIQTIDELSPCLKPEEVMEYKKWKSHESLR